MLVIVGPFGTYQSLPLPIRTVYWSGLVAFSIVLGASLTALMRTVRPGWPPIATEITTATAFALLFTPVLVVVSRQIHPPGELVDMTFGDMFLTVWGIALCVSTIRIAAAGAFHGPAQEPAVAPRLTHRIDRIGVATILCVCSANHHVLVVLSDGRREKLLMRHADAVAEMDGVPGLYIHRSHWVALAAVRGHRRDGGRILLVLQDGTEQPVSRGYLPAVRAAGLLDRA